MYLDGRPLWRVGATGEIDAGRRARQIARRLQGLLEVRDGPPQSARVASDPTNDSQRQIIVAGRVIATVTPADAEARGTSVADLASEWAARLDRGLLQAMQRRLSSHERVLSAVQASIATAFSRLAESAIQVLPRAAAAAVGHQTIWQDRTPIQVARRQCSYAAAATVAACTTCTSSLVLGRSP